MSKKETLSSDLDLVKEFEELKLKQRLLIESLKRKNGSEESQLHKEINSKLDFLVKIFTEAKKKEKENTEDSYLKKFEELSEKLNSMEEKIESLSTSIDEQNKAAKETSKNNLSQKNDDLKKSTSMPPLPDFKVENKEGGSQQS